MRLQPSFTEQLHRFRLVAADADVATAEDDTAHVSDSRLGDGSDNELPHSHLLESSKAELSIKPGAENAEHEDDGIAERDADIKTADIRSSLRRSEDADDVDDDVSQAEHAGDSPHPRTNRGVVGIPERGDPEEDHASDCEDRRRRHGNHFVGRNRRPCGRCDVQFSHFQTSPFLLQHCLLGRPFSKTVLLLYTINLHLSSVVYLKTFS